MKAALISCCKTKGRVLQQAGTLYRSPLFNKSKEWAELKCDQWLILSAKHGVVLPGEYIEPYDMVLSSFTTEQLRGWEAKVVARLRTELPPVCRVVLLTGPLYAEWSYFPGDYRVPGGWSITEPLIGMGIGQRLHWLKTQIENHKTREETEEHDEQQ